MASQTVEWIRVDGGPVQVVNGFVNNLKLEGCPRQPFRMRRARKGSTQTSETLEAFQQRIQVWADVTRREAASAAKERGYTSPTPTRRLGEVKGKSPEAADSTQLMAPPPLPKRPNRQSSGQAMETAEGTEGELRHAQETALKRTQKKLRQIAKLEERADERELDADEVPRLPRRRR